MARREVNLADASGEFKVGPMPFGALCELMNAVESYGVDIGSVFDGTGNVGDVLKSLLLKAPALLSVALTGGPEGKSATGLSSERLAALSVNDTLTLLGAFMKENPLDELIGKAKKMVGLTAQDASAGPDQSADGPGVDTSSTS